MKKFLTLKWWLISAVVLASVCAFLGGYNLRTDPLAANGYFKFAIMQALSAIALAAILYAMKLYKKTV